MQIKKLSDRLSERLRFLESEARPALQWLMEYHTGKDAFFVQLNPEAEVEDAVVERLRLAVDELEKGVPLQYVLHEAWFYGQAFHVDENVLIPRPETEELVHWLLQDAAPDSFGKLLDVCTGSGCIALTFALQRPGWQCTGLDAFDSVLAVARRNAEKLHAAVEWRRCDVLSPVFLQEAGAYDVIVSNPPYVMEREKAEMPERVKCHEPGAALFVPDDDPLRFYRAIAAHARKHLVENGSIYLEINEKLGKETVSLLRDCGFTEVELRQDLQGKDRMIKAKQSR